MWIWYVACEIFSPTSNACKCCQLEHNCIEAVKIYKNFYFRQYETEGLLGYWNNNSTDDLMILGGTHISSESSPQDIYKNFGMLCKK